MPGLSLGLGLGLGLVAQGGGGVPPVSVPAGFTYTPPFQIYRDGLGSASAFRTNYNPESKRPQYDTTIYASLSGNNNNDGLTPATAVRSLSLAAAMGNAAVSAGAVGFRIVATAGIYNITNSQTRSGQPSLNQAWIDALHTSYTNSILGNMIIEPSTPTGIVINLNNRATLTLTVTSDPNIWTGTYTGATPPAFQFSDSTNLDPDGFPMGLNPVDTVADAANPWPEINAAWALANTARSGSGPSKYSAGGASWVDVTNKKVYIRTFDNRNPGASWPIYDTGGYPGMASAATRNLTIWMKNVQFWGGQHGFRIIANSGSNFRVNLYTTNCAALFFGASTSMGGFYASGGGGEIIHHNTYIRGGANDAFAPYGTSSGGTTANNFDSSIINAKTWMTGVSASSLTINSNTAHDLCRTIDIGSRHIDAMDRVVHMIGGTLTWCLGVTASNRRGPSGGATAACFAVGQSGQGSPYATMWLDACKAVDGLNGAAQYKTESYTGGTLYYDNLDFVPAGNPGTGTIQSYNSGGSAGLGAVAPVLLSSDMILDTDDAGAVGLVFGYGGSIVAMINSPRSQEGAPVLSAFANYQGRSSIPVGVDGDAAGFWGGWLAATAGAYGYGSNLAGTAYPADVATMRQALVNSAGGVVLLSIGGLGSYASLLASSGDGISGLTGSQLVAAKCTRMVVMAGNYPTSSSEEFNIGLDRTGAIYVAANSPVPIYWFGQSVGANIQAGPDKNLDQNLNPYRYAYVKGEELDDMDMDANGGRATYDLVAAMFATRGEASPYWTVTGPGTVTINASTGNTSFASGTGTHYYVTATDNAKVRTALNAALALANNPSVSLAAPTGLASSNVASTSFTVTFNRVNGAMSYERRVNGGSWTAVTPSTVAPTTVSFALSGLTPSTLYNVEVRPLRFGVTGTGSAVLPVTTTAIPSYVGPGDITPFAHWYGLRGYSAAYSTGSNPAVDLVDQAGGNPITVNILANGDLDIASISVWVTAHSVTTIKVAKWYDQVGSIHPVQATLANMPDLSLSVISGKAVVVAALANSQRLRATSSGSISQPYTVSAVGRRPTPRATKSFLFGDGGNMGLGWNHSGASPASNTLDFYASTDVVATASDSAFHAIQAVANGASGNIYVDGTSNVLNAGTAAFNLNAINICNDNYGNYMDGYVCEVGVAASGFSVSGGGVASQINSNQRAYWGF